MNTTSHIRSRSNSYNSTLRFPSRVNDLKAGGGMSRMRNVFTSHVCGKDSNLFCDRKYSCSNLPYHLLGPAQTGTKSFHFVPYTSEKWNAEGLRSDGNTSNRTIPFHKMDLLNK